MNKDSITVEVIVEAPVEKAWEYWTKPEHVTQWNFASDTWHCPSAENDLKAGGRFTSRMESKDGQLGFDFGGAHKEVAPHQSIASVLDDGRKLLVEFKDLGNSTKIIETFEPEATHTHEQQRTGWQAILENFKKHVEK